MKKDRRISSVVATLCVLGSFFFMGLQIVNMTGGICTDLVDDSNTTVGVMEIAKEQVQALRLYKDEQGNVYALQSALDKQKDESLSYQERIAELEQEIATLKAQQTGTSSDASSGTGSGQGSSGNRGDGSSTGSGDTYDETTDWENTVYIVKPGDTLTGISKLTRVSVDEIADFNNIEDVNLIYVDDELSFPSVSGTAYLIQDGDTLSEIAMDKEVDLGELADFNKIRDWDKIYADSYLRIPD